MLSGHTHGMPHTNVTASVAARVDFWVNCSARNESQIIHATAARCSSRFTLPPGLALKNLQYLDSGEVVQARDARDGSGLMVRGKGRCGSCHVTRP